MKPVLFAICAAAMALISVQAVHACSYPAGFDQNREISDNMPTVSAIYEGRIEDVAQGSWSGAWDFTLRSTRSIWGERPLAQQRLTRENGACSNWFFINDQDEDEPVAGTNVVVFATPQGIADSLWLYIVRADSPSARLLFQRFGDTAAGRQFETNQ